MTAKANGFSALRRMSRGPNRSCRPLLSSSNASCRSLASFLFSRFARARAKSLFIRSSKTTIAAAFCAFPLLPPPVLKPPSSAPRKMPRVHNSGHWTIEGAVTSQFENHLRAVLGLPLGSTGPAGYSAMLNLIGELPDSSEILAVPDAHLHLYGKSPRPGRKLGHVTLRAASPERLALRLSELPSFFHQPAFCLDSVLAHSASLRA